ncbi:RHS repeat-associated core domain-containing protein [Flavilitoribacter nigricans]|uniref:Uncharacterized protein n=1 Tax=Flavilitoribacter nigricans (strain ATCC 23147 / DSM 23189 / NBRC 102662 / NCIMB 1420 / SS-2) TaxID=1122177 RepID=A0A2D0NJ74_FLAN2|nr:RHS repeat-associated core domain-containing protein [Flavilitoribacter nigricans]PHN07803.1 hypothetical protein CRP01_04590 [Flavilitoribacter nigricans DSM 23189 = NBRC 102662]
MHIRSFFFWSLMVFSLAVQTKELNAQQLLRSNPANEEFATRSSNYVCNNWTFIGSTVKFRITYLTNTVITFELSKNDGSKFTTNGTFYIKVGGYCGTPIANGAVLEGADSRFLSVSIPDDFNSGSLDFYGMYITNAGERYAAGKINVYYDTFLKFENCLGMNDEEVSIGSDLRVNFQLQNLGHKTWAGDVIVLLDEVEGSSYIELKRVNTSIAAKDYELFYLQEEIAAIQAGNYRLLIAYTNAPGGNPLDFVIYGGCEPNATIELANSLTITHYRLLQVTTPCSENAAISITNPDQGNTYNQQINITWAGDHLGNSCPVDIHYYIGSNGSPKPIADNESDDGAYQWNISQNINSDDVYLSVLYDEPNSQGQRVGDVVGPFSIYTDLNAPILSSPENGKEFPSGTTAITYSWAKNNPSGAASYELKLRDVTSDVVLLNFNVPRSDIGSFSHNYNYENGHEYQWTVRAKNLDGKVNEANAFHSFSIGTAGGTANLALDAPLTIRKDGIAASVLRVGETYSFSTIVQNSGGMPWSGSLYLKVGTDVIDLTYPDGLTLADGNSQSITYSFIPTSNQEGEGIPVEIRYQTGGSGSSYPIGSIIHDNPIFIDIMPALGPALLSVTTPASGWQIGETRTIQWTTDNAPDCNAVTIELEVAGNTLYVLKENHAFSNSSGSFSWQVGYDQNGLLIPNVDASSLQLKIYCTGSNSPIGYSQPFSLSNGSGGICSYFTDLPSSGEIFEAAQCLCSQGYITPQGGAIDADAPIYRADLAKLVFFALYDGDEAAPSDAFPLTFADLYYEADPAQKAYYRYAKALSYLEYGDGVTPFDRDRMLFNPYGTIDKIDALKVILEAFNISPDFSGPNPFPGYIDLAHPSYGYVKKASTEKWCTFGTDLFQPISRKHVFLILYRLLSGCDENNSSIYQNSDPGSEAYFTPGNLSPENLARSMGMDEGFFKYREQTSFNIPGFNLSLNFSHFYNTAILELPTSLRRITPLGDGWSHSYNCYLVEEKGWNDQGFSLDDRVYVFWPGGQVHAYNGTNFQTISHGVFDELTKVNNTTYRIKKKNLLEYTFTKYTLLGGKAEVFMLSEIKDRFNNIIQIIHEKIVDAPRIKKVIGTAGRELRFYYQTGSNQLSQVKDVAGGRDIYFNVNDDNNLLSYTNAREDMTYYDYGTNAQFHLLYEITLPRGNKISGDYDAITRKLKQVSYPGNVFYEVNLNPNYDNAADFLSNVKDATGTEVKKYRNENGLVEKKSINNNGNLVDLEYRYNSPVDPFLVSSIDYEGYELGVSYDNKGNLIDVNLPTGINHHFTYTSWNDIKTYRDPKGNTTTYDYIGYALDKVTDNMGFVTDVSIDSRGKMTSVKNPENITYIFGYDNFGNQKRISGPLGIETTAEFDEVGRLKKLTNPNGQVATFEYDVHDLIRKATQQSATGDLVSEYDYDKNDNLNWIKNAKGNKTNFNYTLLDQLATVEFGGDTKAYTYLEDGLLDTYSKPGGHTFQYEYDDLGRLESDGYAGYTYDTQDNIKTISKTGGSTVAFDYDDLNRMKTATYESQTVGYDYDINSNVKKITYPGGFSVTYDYDANNRLTDVRWLGKTVHYDYYDDGRLQKTTYPNGTYCNYNYDAAGRMIGLTNRKSNTEIIAAYSFTLDPMGNHLGEDRTEPFGDPALTPVVHTGSYNSENEVNTYAATNFSFNSDGQQTSKGVTASTWDDRDMLLTYGSNSYAYDGMGLRRSATRDGITRKYIWDVRGMGNVLVETDGSGNALYYYIHGLGLCARVKVSNDAAHYYHYDFRGSTIAMTDNGENITHQYSYLPYGGIAGEQEADPNPFKFVGQYGVMHDGDELYYMRARYYDAQTGRFLSEDPVWGENLYAYGGGNPTMFIDPKGTIEADLKGCLIPTPLNLVVDVCQSFDGGPIEITAGPAIMSVDNTNVNLDISAGLCLGSKKIEDKTLGFIKADVCFSLGADLEGKQYLDIEGGVKFGNVALPINQTFTDYRSESEMATVLKPNPRAPIYLNTNTIPTNKNSFSDIDLTPVHTGDGYGAGLNLGIQFRK